MTSPLESTNPYGIRVAADRAPVRAEARDAFAKASREARTGISNLTGKAANGRATSTGQRKRAKSRD
jgi:hypothetical protein